MWTALTPQSEVPARVVPRLLSVAVDGVGGVGGGGGGVGRGDGVVVIRDGGVGVIGPGPGGGGVRVGVVVFTSLVRMQKAPMLAILLAAVLRISRPTVVTLRVR